MYRFRGLVVVDGLLTGCKYESEEEQWETSNHLLFLSSVEGAIATGFIKLFP